MVDCVKKSTRCDCGAGNSVDVASVILNCERLRSAYDRMGCGGEPFAHSCAEAGSLLMFEYAVAREVSFVVEADDYGGKNRSLALRLVLSLKSKSSGFTASHA